MNYYTEIYYELPVSLRMEWESVWLKSGHGHIFNSPLWYEACLVAESVERILIIICRDNNHKLLGILPLIRSKKFGFSVYLSPGHKYLDKSTLFIDGDFPQVFVEMLNKLNRIGNYYLTEVDEKIAREIQHTSRSIGISQCSEGRYLEIGDDPLRNLSKENKRRLLKRLREDLTLTCDIGSSDIHKNIEKAHTIEMASTKAKNHKEIFSDPYLLKLCEQINSISPGVLNFTFLYHDGEPICYKYGFITHDIYHYSNTAYKLASQKLSPGRLLMIMTFRLLQKEGIKFIDFSRGDTAFKREFSTSLYRQYTLYYMISPLSMFIWKIMYKLKGIINL